jgi:hypothetical protein
MLDQSSENLPTPPAVASGERWLELWRETAAWGYGGLTAVALFRDVRQLQRRWLAELASATELWLRTPEVLQLMQHTVEALTRPPQLVSPIPPRKETADGA